MSTTPLKLISGAMRLLASTSAEQTPSPEEQTDGLEALNAISQSWSAQGVLLFQISQDSIVMTGGASYPVPSPRPIKLKAASVTATITGSIPLLIADAPSWAALPDKAGTSTFGKMLFYSEGFPTAN